MKRARLDRRGAPRGAAVDRHRQLPAAPHDHVPAVGLRVYQLVDHGPPRPGQPRPRRVPRHRRVRGRDAVEPLRPVALARHAGRASRSAALVALRDRLPVLPLPHRRPLLRAGHARALRGRRGWSSSRCATRPAARSARRRIPRSRRATPGRSARCSSPTRWSGSTSCSPSGWAGCGSGARVDRAWRGSRCEAISQEEDAAASVGINVTRSKLGVTLISALMTCVGGVLYAQYQLYVNPETVSGIGISLQMVFGVIAGGMFVQLGPDGRRGVHAAAGRGPAARARRHSSSSRRSTRRSTA